jgi:hypothetical protein
LQGAATAVVCGKIVADALECTSAVGIRVIEVLWSLGNGASFQTVPANLRDGAKRCHWLPSQLVNKS